MRYSKNRKLQTRQQIVASACRCFTRNGYAATSIDDIMSDCGLTRGGFYAHFKSKSELYREAIDFAATRSATQPRARVGWLDAMLDQCFSLDNPDDADASHWTFFATDVGSAELNVRSAYTTAVKTMSNQIRRQVADEASCDDAAVLPMTAMIIGAMAIAQTTDDAGLKARLVASCKEQARMLLENPVAAPSFFWAI